MRRQNSGLKNIIIILILGAVIAGAAFLYMSPIFEKNAPKISFKNNNYWNLKEDLNVSLNDESGIKSYKAYYIVNNEQKILVENSVKIKQTDVVFKIPTFDVDSKTKKVDIFIEVTDNSLWNFFQGNQSFKKLELNIDRKRPTARVISNSYNIRRGGSAVVVVEVNDENLEEKYISFNEKYNFELIPFLKEGFYAAIIAWPIEIEFDDFERVNLVAIDKANNKTITKVPLYIKDLKIKTDRLKISDNFINKVSIPVLKMSDMTIPDSSVEVFIKQNNILRDKNVNVIKTESVKNMSKDMVTRYDFNAFKRLKNSKTFAGFAEKREYYYEGDLIDRAWHLGMDWASIKHADIKVSNRGKVIYNDYLGIYGNTIIIDHKLGLQTLYAHTSKFKVQKDDIVKPNQKIALTGSTGAVFGDHLHFGVLVQGIEVNPLEWMDKSWIKTRITNILDEAKQEIKSSK